MPRSESATWASRPASTPPDLADSYAELLALVVAEPDLDVFLRSIVQLAAQVVVPAAACGLTVHRDGKPMTAAVTSPLATFADEAQYDLDEGPCLCSLRTGEVVEIPDMARDSRWREFAEQAYSQGVKSSLSLPLSADGETVGALNLYAEKAHVFTDGVREGALAFAARASGALSLMARRQSEAELNRQLQEALGSRSIIDQALGVLMTQRCVDADEAFVLLRDASSRSNRKVRDLASEIVEKASGKPLVTAPTFRRGRPGPRPRLTAPTVPASGP